MKLGFVSAILPELSLEQVLAFARDEQFSTVEIMAWPVGRAERRYAGVTHVDVTTLTPTRADDLNDLCGTYGVSMSALGFYPNTLDPDPDVSKAAVDHLKKAMKGAAMLGLKLVTSFVGRDWTKTVDENWPRFLKVWKPLIKFAEDLDIRIAIENCPMLFTRDEWPGGKNLMTTPAIWRRAFGDLDSPSFGLNFDPSHLVLQQMDAEKPLHEFKDRIFHFHAKDVRIRRDALNDVGIFAFPLQWHQPRLPGYGELNWTRYMGTLREIGFEGPVCVEVEDDTFGRTLEGRKRALRVARNILGPHVGA